MTEKTELFGTASCPHTADLREDLEWRGIDFVEHDVDRDPAALARMLELTGGRAAVPVLVEGGEVTRIGWQGRTCPVTVPPGLR
jgi:mycoredoxin